MTTKTQERADHYICASMTRKTGCATGTKARLQALFCIAVHDRIRSRCMIRGEPLTLFLGGTRRPVQRAFLIAAALRRSAIPPNDARRARFFTLSRARFISFFIIASGAASAAVAFTHSPVKASVRALFITLILSQTRKTKIPSQ